MDLDLSLLRTKDGQLKKKFGFFDNFIENGIMHGVHMSGHRYSYAEHCACIEMCDLLGLSYTIGNDSPRGGQLGTYVQLTPESIENTEALRNEIINKRKEYLMKREEECERRMAHNKKTYKLCHEKNISLSPEQHTHLWSLNSKGRKHYLHVLAHSFGLVNNDGFRAYIREKYPPIN